MNTLRRGKPSGPSVPYSPATDLVGVGQQRELQPELGGERLVALDALRRDAQHLGVERLELRRGRRLYELSCLVHTGVSSPG